MNTNDLYQKDEDFERLHRTFVISFLAVLVGIISGFGAVLFRYLIGFFHNLFFHGTFCVCYNSEEPFISRWGWLVVLVPAVGIALADWLTRRFAPEAKGHGVPEVMAAVMENRGKIRPVVALVKSLASAITIGSGGSVGREGPIVQIGASFGSSLGQMLKLAPREVIILVGAGVAGSIGGTFNAPIGGIMFALELVLPEYSIMTIMPLVISSIIATHISILILGASPAFILPMYSFVSSWELIFYLVLGLAAGFIAIGFIRSLYAVEDLFDRIRVHATVKAVAGGILVGSIGLFCLKVLGQYYVFGVGYAFLSEILSNAHPHLLVVLGLIVLKILAASLTLASGGSGGIFAPSLFLGAATGAALGLLVNEFFPDVTARPSAYAIVGMAAMVSGVTGASLTAIIMIFEMTRNYNIMLPLMLSVVVAHFISARFYGETIYTKKLTRRGIMIQLDKKIPIFKTMQVADILRNELLFCSPNQTIEKVLEIMHSKSLGILPVLEDGRLLGTISYEELYKACVEPSETIDGLYTRRNISISAERNLVEALDRMKQLHCSILVAREKGEITGYITRNMIISSYLEKRSAL